MRINKRIILLLRPLTRKFSSLMKTYRFLRDNKIILDAPKQTPMGFKLSGNKSMENGTFEPTETEIVKKILPNVDVVLNVGANIGYYCCLALQQGKYVVAFEPIWSNLRYFYENIKANRWEDKVEIFPMALSNRAGIIEIFGSGTGASLVQGWADTSDDYATLVPTTTIDLILGSRFQKKKCFVLVDVEGAEKLMLEGASALLVQEPKPIWLVEIAITEHQPCGAMINPNLVSTFQIFWEKGYEAWTAENQMRLVQPEEVVAIFKQGRDSLHTHNFLFIERDRKINIFDAQ